jgi:hypothetical protein
MAEEDNNDNLTDEAKQLDMVTDRVQEKELDASKAQEAMSALVSGGAKANDALSQIQVSKEDVDLIVNELEVTEAVAERALREVAAQAVDEQPLVVAALRKLVASQ